MDSDIVSTKSACYICISLKDFLLTKDEERPYGFLILYTYCYDIVKTLIEDNAYVCMIMHLLS